MNFQSLKKEYVEELGK